MDPEPKTNSCFTCNRTFHKTATRYYCCNPSQLFCIKCHNNRCSQCLHSRFNTIQMIQCALCENGTEKDRVFYEFQGDKNVCVLCMQALYGESVMGKMEMVQVNDFYCEIQQVELFLSGFCWLCLKVPAEGQASAFLKNGNVAHLLCPSCLPNNTLTPHQLLKTKPRPQPKPTTLRCAICSTSIGKANQLGICEKCLEMSFLVEQNFEGNIPKPPRMEEQMIEQKHFLSQIKKQPLNFIEKEQQQQMKEQFPAQKVIQFQQIKPDLAPWQQNMQMMSQSYEDEVILSGKVKKQKRQSQNQPHSSSSQLSPSDESIPMESDFVKEDI